MQKAAALKHDPGMCIKIKNKSWRDVEAGDDDNDDDAWTQDLEHVHVHTSA